MLPFSRHSNQYGPYVYEVRKKHWLRFKAYRAYSEKYVSLLMIAFSHTGSTNPQLLSRYGEQMLGQDS